ncbi:hypothetical protein M378DRAFT_73676 [Amanita muscaria Koide BX008]|uniref:RecQ-mediated genome instability protein 1 n=1 Tax=Amanita muscaria (strain Koide BX008) TaxID=946122 RepID=A0A0C2XFB2_AMAMK|nr:hypothetical protein M378DRAFT_73676 [Amanita muscaria Koide BX008]
MAQHFHPRLQQWLDLHYPKPKLDPMWFNDFQTWVQNVQGITLESDFQAFTKELESQLLSSSLSDSTEPATGLHTHIAVNTMNTVIRDLVLVEITAITEIAHSAFNLDQIRVAREERERLGHSTDSGDDGDIEIDEGPPPKYPTGMLKLELTDGNTKLPAIEYRPLPEIKLGVTPLGYKVSISATCKRHNQRLPAAAEKREDPQWDSLAGTSNGHYEGPFIGGTREVAEV